MNREELQKIVDATDRSWIPLPHWEMPDGVPLEEDVCYELEAHYRAETNFLIQKCRELSRLLLNKEDSSLPHTKCMICDNVADWERCTQFAGIHPFCNKCAEKEENFGKEDSSYFYWKSISV